VPFDTGVLKISHQLLKLYSAMLYLFTIEKIYLIKTYKIKAINVIDLPIRRQL